MRYSIEPRERRYVKGYGFMSFARNFGNKYGKKLINTAIKTATKIVHKSAEATGDLIGNKIADKITAKPSKKKHIMKMKLLMEYQKKDIFLLKKDKKLLMN